MRREMTIARGEQLNQLVDAYKGYAQRAGSQEEKDELEQDYKRRVEDLMNDGAIE